LPPFSKKPEGACSHHPKNQTLPFSFETTCANNAKFQPDGKREVKYAFTFPAPPGVHPEQWLNKLRERLGDISKRPLVPR
jgi:hypothetical protein